MRETPLEFKEEQPRHKDLPPDTTLILHNDEIAKTSPELVGCRIVILENSDTCILNHYGPMSNNQLLERLRDLHLDVKISKISIYALNLYNIPDNQEFLSITKMRYELELEKLRTELALKYPESVIDIQRYDPHINLEISRDKNKTVVHEVQKIKL